MGKKNQIEICRLCNHKNDIAEKIELNDWDKSWREGYILIYCDKCSNQIEVRRK